RKQRILTTALIFIVVSALAFAITRPSQFRHFWRWFPRKLRQLWQGDCWAYHEKIAELPLRPNSHKSTLHFGFAVLLLNDRLTCGVFVADTLEQYVDHMLAPFVATGLTRADIEQQIARTDGEGSNHHAVFFIVNNTLYLDQQMMFDATHWSFPL